VSRLVVGRGARVGVPVNAVDVGLVQDELRKQGAVLA